MVTLSERQKNVQNVNISRRKIKKYVEKLRLLNSKKLCRTFRTFCPCFIVKKRYILYNIIDAYIFSDIIYKMQLLGVILWTSLMITDR